MEAASEFIQDLAEHISMPDVYLKVRQLIEQHDSQIEDFVNVIQNDSMLAVRIIRVANSPFFGFPRRAESLHQAISLIGIMQLHDLVLSCLCIRTFSSVPKQIFNLEAFWKYSIECGIAARTIAQCSLTLPTNLYFSLGLLHEIGHAAMFLKSPELSLQALDKSMIQGKDITELERDYFGFDYTQIGQIMMQQWNLPDLYQQATSFHLQPENTDATYRHTANIIHLAHSICQNPVAGQHQELINNIKANDTQLQQLPSNIDEVIFKEIEVNADTLLDMLWPSKAQIMPMANRLQH